MTITISKTQFEQAVPAFRSATSDIFDALASRLAEAADEVSAFIGTLTTEEESETITERAVRLAVLTACRRALPHLDLVLTPTGFGVVSNQNVAPASRDRVAALAEQLRKDESLTRDLLTFALLTTSWAASPRAQERIASLLWCPMLCRRSGIKTADGREVYEEEYRTLLPHIRMAETYLVAEISPELLRALIERQRTAPTSEETLYTLLQEKSRRILAVMLTDTKGVNHRAIRRMTDELLDLVKHHADSLPEYRDSATAEAHRFERYENKQQDGTFFW